jgi:hypothetical protein
MKLKRKNFGFIGNMFGAKNFQNIARMSAVNKARPGTFGTGKFAGNALAGTAKAAGSTALVAGGLAIGTGALAKKGIEKAGEQSDGSKLFSQTKKKNNMATTYRLKRKIFADFKNMSTEKLEKIVTQDAGAGNTIVAGAKQELSSRTPALATPKPTPKPNVSTTKPGMMSVLRTKWNGLSRMGKIGVGAGVLGAAGLMAKGLMGNKKDQ